jgi:hypothetical protein
VAELEFLRYLTPDAMHKVLQSLERRHSLVVLRDEVSGQVTEIGQGA